MLLKECVKLPFFFFLFFFERNRSPHCASEAMTAYLQMLPHVFSSFATTRCLTHKDHVVNLQVVSYYQSHATL